MYMHILCDIYIYIYICDVCCVYIYIYRERERDMLYVYIEEKDLLILFANHAQDCNYYERYVSIDGRAPFTCPL